jgi:hypothetical protein
VRLGEDRLVLLLRGVSPVERIEVEQVWTRAGDPQYAVPAVLVGGTNGKGRLVTALSAMLSRRYRTGAFIKPHLKSIRERWRLGDADVDADSFAAAAERARRGPAEQGPIAALRDGLERRLVELGLRYGCTPLVNGSGPRSVTPDLMKRMLDTGIDLMAIKYRSLRGDDMLAMVEAAGDRVSIDREAIPLQLARPGSPSPSEPRSPRHRSRRR